ncbi:MAG: aspartate aminotransferase family protein, partial [Nitrososphaeraceae archaeon]|nr:aspartate aminotransferase family protein [Nitrososphaeraceae archaeon]
VTGIRDNISEFNQFFTINSISSLFQIFFTSEKINSPLDVKKSDQNLFERHFWNLLNSNIFIPPSQLESCFISYSHTEENIEKTIEIYSESLIKIMKEK